MQLLLAVTFAAVIAFEIVRRQPILIGQLAKRLFSPILRSSELGDNAKLTGAFYMLAGALFTSLTFPKEIAVTALAVLMISDSAAALIGKCWGRHSIVGKSIEGSAAFLFSAILITGFIAIIGSYPTIPFLISGCLACVSATLCELYAPRLKLDDNLLIPLAFATMQMITLSLLPSRAIS